MRRGVSCVPRAVRVWVLLTMLMTACHPHSEITADHVPPRREPERASTVRFAAHAKMGEPLRIDGCVGAAPCTEWIRFPSPC